MSDYQRYEFRFDMQDPLDVAIWEVLRPLIRQRRAAHTIRDALARILLPGGSSNASAIPPTKAIPLSAPVPSIEPPDSSGNDLAADNFLSMFG